MVSDGEQKLVNDNLSTLVGALAFSGAYFGQGIGTAQYGNFLCTNESKLLQALLNTETSCVLMNQSCSSAHMQQ